MSNLSTYRVTTYAGNAQLAKLRVRASTHELAATKVLTHCYLRAGQEMPTRLEVARG